MKSERKSIENEYCRIVCCRFCSSVGEIFRYSSIHISSETTDDVCGSDERESCEVFSLWSCLVELEEVVSKLGC
jgi:hypothetical protein